ncbi:hypothetical protein [Actinophytocola xanthii]|uniref:YbaB/EbfC family DNA-binding protein n=1 Tax=Actinophytocola xanthii TaxID=1912961 RepID=A0A1Q8BUL2_9PSEU|nr:hypothetical protein [Actinophytocola xanthii]OLF05800.1 hypothetical protein BU204_36860 [Actinophytocola xanthii]
MVMGAGFEALHQLAGEAERMSRVLAGPAPAEHAGQDRSGTVHVVVDEAGAVVDARLDRDWYDSVDARVLGAAVLEAVDAAGVARLSAWAEAVAEAQETTGSTSVAPPPVPAGPVHIDPPADLVDRLLTLLHRAGREAEAEAKTAAAAEDYRRRLVRGSSDGGHVTVGMDGPRVVEVQIETDTRWIGTANHLEIASELRSAFEAARAAVAEAAPRRRSDSAIEELRALTDNPREFVAALFGTRL